MASFKLPLKSLSLGVQDFNYHLGDDVFNETETIDAHHGDVNVQLSVERKTNDIFQLHFEFDGHITISCDRCLDDMEWEVETDYDISVKFGEDYDDSRENVLVIPSHWRELDLLPIMRDSVLLTIPIKHVHPEGECNELMMERLGAHKADLDDDNRADSDADNENEKTFTLGDDPRWEALKNFKDNN